MIVKCSNELRVISDEFQFIVQCFIRGLWKSASYYPRLPELLRNLHDAPPVLPQLAELLRDLREALKPLQLRTPVSGERFEFAKPWFVVCNSREFTIRDGRGWHSHHPTAEQTLMSLANLRIRLIDSADPAEIIELARAIKADILWVVESGAFMDITVIRTEQ